MMTGSLYGASRIQNRSVKSLEKSEIINVRINPNIRVFTVDVNNIYKDPILDAIKYNQTIENIFGTMTIFYLFVLEIFTYLKKFHL